MQSELRHTEPYQTDENTPTLSLVTGSEDTAFPYHLVRSMQLDGEARRIAIDLDEYAITIKGSNLGKLWRELRAYRVKEVSTNTGEAARAVGSKANRVIVESITILTKEADA